MNETPYLKTERLRLYAPYHRAFAVERQVKWLNNARIMRYSEQRHGHHTLKSQQHFIDSFDQVHRHLWEIAQRHGTYNYPIGTITALRNTYNKTANVGILIGRKASWGRGYGLEAWKAVCDWLLSDDTRKIEAGAAARNGGMLRIFEKSGMTIEGCQIGALLLEDGPCDIILAGRFKDELPKRDGFATLAQQAGHQGDGRSVGPSGTYNRTRIACGA